MLEYKLTRVICISFCETLKICSMSLNLCRFHTSGKSCNHEYNVCSIVIIQRKLKRRNTSHTINKSVKTVNLRNIRLL